MLEGRRAGKVHRRQYLPEPPVAQDHFCDSVLMGLPSAADRGIVSRDGLIPS